MNDQRVTGGQAVPSLTPRQREILRLLCEGKVNKEIARELGIGVGTVKQHVVALFKRLNVRNRAMAVSHGMALLEEEARARDGAPAVDSPGLAEEGILVRRPCVVLSVALPATASEEAARHLHRTLAGLAYDGEALFLAREGGAGDLLFGVRRASEHDLVAALQLVAALHREMGEREPLLADQLRGGLGVGMAIVSKHRHGGWSGEAVASPVIAGARKRLQGCAPGELGFDAAVAGVMEAFGLHAAAAPSGCIALSRLGELFRLGSADEPPPLGRAAEWQRIDRALTAGEGRLLRLEGETGMGKSRLCRVAAARCRELGGRVVYLRGLPVAGMAPLCDTGDGGSIGVAEVEGWLERPVTATPELLVIDDFHLLSAGMRGRLAARAEAAVIGGRVVVLAGRRVSDAAGSERIHLRRLDDDAVEGLLRARGGDGAVGRAGEVAGVPLFAAELARAPADELPLPLVMTIASRLDGFELDWKLLLTLAQGEAAMSTAELAEAMGEPMETVSRGVVVAIRAGVLALAEAAPVERVGFHHPLIRRVVALLGVEWGV